jgi:hypothetical protein
MVNPRWLQELRDIIGLPAYDERQRALLDWQDRWLVELQARICLTAVEMMAARENMLEYAQDRLSRNMGQAMSALAAELSVQGSPVDTSTEVRMKAWTLRREPKPDAPVRA